MVIAERGEDGVRDFADAHLEGGAVGDEEGDVASNGLVDLVEGVDLALRKEVVHGTRCLMRFRRGGTSSNT